MKRKGQIFIRAILGMIALLYRTPPSQAAGLAELADLSALRARFNEDRGAIRLVLLLSPTCPYCVRGARWVREEILKKQPEARLKVYAIWFNMIWTDSRSRWPEDVLADPRVEHFWDAEKIVGRWYEEHVTHRGDEVEWDAFFLYAPGVSWGETLPPAVTWGRPILHSKDQLRDGLRTLREDKKTREESDG